MMAKREPENDGTLSTLSYHRFVPSPAPSASFVVRVVEGPDLGLTLTVDGTQPARSLIGSGPSADLRLSDRTVSRRHAALEVVDSRLRLTDLGSANGTSVNELAVVDAFLVGHESLRMGATKLRVEVEKPRAGVTLDPATGFGRLIGMSREMQRLYPLCAKLAAAEVPVIIEGETGTGKEVLAESLHEMGPRAAGPYVVFDCTAVPPNLVESELFGHERGAFTGAVAARKGVFEQADGGTLLIDEIGDLDLPLQAKLLRAVERLEVRRVGGDRAIRADVRVLAATRRDLDREVQRGRFRDDLFHRLAVTRIELPPLRRRRGDVPLLAGHFAERLSGARGRVPSALLSRWEDYDWPGNVRELRNAVARWAALGDDSEELASSASGVHGPGEASQVPDFIVGVLACDLPIDEARRHVVDHFERRYIHRVLDANGGDVARAAAVSGIARRHFNRIRARTKD